MVMIPPRVKTSQWDKPGCVLAPFHSSDLAPLLDELDVVTLPPPELAERKDISRLL